jgi:uncharacterized phiE125 gp8 family phage protein
MLYVVTPPRSEPVTLSELRGWLAMTDDNDTAQDPQIWAIAKAMRAYAEKYTGRRFVDTALELNLDYWQSRVIELPVAPIVSIDYVRYIDSSGTLQALYDNTSSPTVGADAIAVDLKSQPARLSPPWAGFWPTIRGGDFNAVQIGFTAGYGTGGSPQDLSVIPAELKLWLRVRLATLYENREALIVGTVVNEIPRDFNDALLDPLVLGRRIG